MIRVIPFRVSAKNRRARPPAARLVIERTHEHLLHIDIAISLGGMRRVPFLRRIMINCEHGFPASAPDGGAARRETGDAEASAFSR